MNLEESDIKSLHKSFILIESRMKVIMKENEELKEQVKSLSNNNRELANMYTQKVIDNEKLHAEVKCLTNEKRKLIDLNMLEPTEIEDNISYLKKFSGKRIKQLKSSYPKSKKKKNGITDACNIKHASDNHLASNLSRGGSKKCPIKEKVWVCFGCTPPKLLSEDKFLNHANFYLHLNSCIAYTSVDEASTAMLEYQSSNKEINSQTSFMSIDPDVQQVDHINTVTNDGSNCLNDDFIIKSEIIDLGYCWNSAFDKEIEKHSAVDVIPDEKVLKEVITKSETQPKIIKITKSEIKPRIIKCSKCLVEFPTRERKLLHTCNSISDRYYVSKE